MASNRLWIAGAFNRPSTPAQRISVRQSSKSSGTVPVLACCRASERVSEQSLSHAAPCYPCCPMLSVFSAVRS